MADMSGVPPDVGPADSEPDVVERFPQIAEAILGFGFLVYAVFCVPVIRCRAFSDIDPFVLAFPWLWVVPIVLSAPLVRMSRRRAWGLVAYAFAGGMIVGGCCGGMSVPRWVGFHEIVVVGLSFFGPILLVAAAVVETGTRVLFRCLRMHPGGGAAPDLRKFIRFLVVVGLLTVAFPFVFRTAVLAHERTSGRRYAEETWNAGDAILFVLPSEWEENPLMFEIYDAATGLRMYPIYGGIARRTASEAAREVIHRKLAEFGPAPMSAYLLSAEELESLAGAGRLGDAARSLSESDALGVARDYAYGFAVHDERPELAGETVATEKGGTRVVLKDGMIETYHPDDWLMQRYHVWAGAGAREAARESPSRKFAEKMRRLMQKRSPAPARGAGARDAGPAGASQPGVQSR